MKEKDCKAITEIIKSIKQIPNRKLLGESERLFGYDKALKEVENKLADYFEKLKNDC